MTIEANLTITSAPEHGVSRSAHIVRLGGLFVVRA
jgi:hypothetical protein